jgi:flagellin-like protein
VRTEFQSAFPSPASRRGQSNVVGVALLLGITVVALAALTAGVGSVVEDTAESADAARVADGFERVLRPVETTGTRRGQVAFSDGELRTVERELRVIGGGGTRVVGVDALVYEAGGRRVTFLAGAVVDGDGEDAQLHRSPPITASRGRGGVLVVGAPRLNGSSTAVAGSAGPVELATNVTHDRTDLGRGRYRVAVETAVPSVWRDAFERSNATVTSIRDFDGDGIDSVVARFPGERTAHLVVHDMRLEVGP